MVEPISSPGSLRVALVTGGLKLGGTTTFLCNLAGELVRRKIPVEVLSFEKENPLASDLHAQNIPVLCQDERRLIFEDRLLAILQAMRQFKPTVVVANLSATSFEVLRYVPPGVFRVGAAHVDHAGVDKMMSHYSAHLDALVAVSQTIKNKLQAMPDFARVPVHYLPCGVPMLADAGVERNFQHPLRILYLGRLEREQKRVHLFPAIFEQLKSSGISFHWTIAGDGPEKAWLEANMRSSPPEQTVSFPGKIPYREVPRLLSEHDIFLLASDHEGLPLALLEAMGYGLVPVVSDLPSGIPELVDETTGRRVPPDNTKGYAEAIIQLHEHRNQMEQISRAARQKVQREYSIAAMTDRWLKLFPRTPVGPEWSQKWSLKRPLTSDARLRFSLPGRVFARLAFKLRRQVFEQSPSSPS